MNINKYIEQAYGFFKGLATEMAKIVKDGNKDVTTGLVEAKTAIVDSQSKLADAINKLLTDIVTAIEDKPVVESVEISNIGELSDKIGQVVETLKVELGKIDKEIVVKNDLSQLTALFKSGEDKKDLIKALRRIEDGVNEEKPDYTLILDELVTLVENIKPEIDLSGVLELLAQISVGCNMEMPDHLAKYAKYDRLKIDISDEQLKKMASSVTVASGGGNNLSGMIHSNIHTAHQELRTYSEGHVCIDNSTSTPLGINGVFTGGWQDTLDYSEIIISVGTDKPSITNGLQVLWSADAINIHGDDVFTISANADKTFSFPCQRRYVKVIYTNDGVAQTRFNLSTLLKRFASKGSSHRLADNLDQQDDAIVTKSMIAGFTTAGGGGIVNVKVNPSGALNVAVGESALPTGAATETTLQKLVGFDENSDLTISVVTVGTIKTITETDGVKTRTTVVDSTDPLAKDITVTWT